jgi:hypothetical protein
MSIHLFFAIPTLGALAAATLPGIAQLSSASSKTCISVLFVGDSVTYVNNLPELVSKIAESKNRCVIASMIASGGESLRDHWLSGDVERALKARYWQYVVVQDQSSFGEVYLVNGKYRVHDATELFAYGHRILAMVRRHGGKPVVFLPWTARSAEARDAQYVRWAYVKFARDERALLVPAMDAWGVARSELPDVNFFLPDGLHPTAAGSYLTAALFYAAIAKASPLGATTTILGPPVDFQTGTIVPRATVLLADVPEQLGKRLQLIAMDVAQRGFPSQPVKPAPISLPRLPTGQAIRIGTLDGQWAGPIRLYPYPATMTLEVCTRPVLSIGATIDFGGRPNSIRFVDRRPTVGAKSFAFTDAHGPNGGRVRYTAVLKSSALAGIGEILVRNAPIYGIGIWSVTRRTSRCSTAVTSQSRNLAPK